MKEGSITLSHRERMTAIVLLYGTCLTVLAPSAVGPVLPLIAKAFADVENIQLLSRMVLTMPALFMAITAPLAGILARKFGKIRIFQGAICLYAISAPAGMLASTIEELLVSRAFVGVALGASMPMAIALIGDRFPGRKRIKVMGSQAAVQEFSTVIFSLLAGIVASIGWRGPFGLYFLALPLLLLAFLYLKQPTETDYDQKSDLSNITSERVSLSAVVTAYLIGTAGMISLFLIPIHGPFMVAELLDETSTFRIAAMMSALTIAAGTSAWFYSRLREKLDTEKIFAVCFLLIAIGYYLLSRAGSYEVLIIGSMVSGFGVGFFLPNINLWVVGMGSMAQRGMLVSGLMSCIFIGQFLCPILTTPIVQQHGVPLLFRWTAGLALSISAAFIIASVARERRKTIVEEHT